MTKKIPLQNGMVATVDEEDYERCMHHNWTICSGNITTFKVHSTIDGEKVTLQSFIKKADKGSVLSFDNLNRLDFRGVNIVKRSKAEMLRNSKGDRDSSSKYKGVHWVKSRKKWRADIRVDGKTVYLGVFSDEDDAAKAYNSAVLKFWGEDCYLNIIGENNNCLDLTFPKRTVYRKRKGSKSSYLGVVYNKSKGWSAKLKEIHLGSFLTETEAAKAYDKKAIELHGDKAILNFPERGETKFLNS